MSDTFLYSEATEDGYTNEVTPEDLNNIAIDLGIPDYSRFPEEPPQSAVAALNGITQDLTTKGVLQIGSKCEVSIADGVVTVADGVIVFDSGAKKRLETAVTLNFIEGAVNYVYAFNNVSGNQIQLICGHDAPVDGTDYVMLAEVSEGQVVSDKRYWSISKVGNGVNITQEITQSFTFKTHWYNSDTDELTPRYSKYEFDIPYGANYFIILTKYYTSRYPIAIRLIEGEEVEFCADPGYGDENFILKKEGSKLYISSWQGGWNKNNSIGTEYNTFTFYLA